MLTFTSNARLPSAVRGFILGSHAEFAQPERRSISTLFQFERELCPSGPPETRCRKYGRSPIESLFARTQTKQVCDLLCKMTFASHARPEAWIVESSAAKRFQPAEDLLSVQRAVGQKPVVEEILQTVG